MGVRSLWNLLAPCGRRTSVDALARKRLAIDASIWLIQFIKAMRDDKGEMMRNAPLLGLFRRICKLIYLHVRPVLVFDGATPVLKRRTVARRQAFRQRQEGSLRRTAEKLLLNQMKGRHLLHGIENSGAGINSGRTVPPPPSHSAAAASSAVDSQFADEDDQVRATAAWAGAAGDASAQASPDESDDDDAGGFHAEEWEWPVYGDEEVEDFEAVGPSASAAARGGGGGGGSSGRRSRPGAVASVAASSGSSSAAAGTSSSSSGTFGRGVDWEASLRLVDAPTLQECLERAAEKQGHDLEEDASYGQLLVPRAGQLDPAVLRRLPPAMQFEVLEEIKLTERSRRVSSLVSAAQEGQHTMESFSHQQLLNYIEVSKVAVQVNELRAELSKDASKSRPIASDASRRYIFYDTTKEGEEAGEEEDEEEDEEDPMDGDPAAKRRHALDEIKAKRARQLAKLANNDNFGRAAAGADDDDGGGGGFMANDSSGGGGGFMANDDSSGGGGGFMAEEDGGGGFLPEDDDGEGGGFLPEDDGGGGGGGGGFVPEGMEGGVEEAELARAIALSYELSTAPSEEERAAAARRAGKERVGSQPAASHAAGAAHAKARCAAASVSAAALATLSSARGRRLPRLGLRFPFLSAPVSSACMQVRAARGLTERRRRECRGRCALDVTISHRRRARTLSLAARRSLAFIGHDGQRSLLHSIATDRLRSPLSSCTGVAGEERGDLARAIAASLDEQRGDALDAPAVHQRRRDARHGGPASGSGGDVGDVAEVIVLIDEEEEASPVQRRVWASFADVPSPNRGGPLLRGATFGEGRVAAFRRAADEEDEDEGEEDGMDLCFEMVGEEGDDDDEMAQMLAEAEEGRRQRKQQQQQQQQQDDNDDDDDDERAGAAIGAGLRQAATVLPAAGPLAAVLPSRASPAVSGGAAWRMHAKKRMWSAMKRERDEPEASEEEEAEALEEEAEVLEEEAEVEEEEGEVVEEEGEAVEVAKAEAAKVAEAEAEGAAAEEAAGAVADEEMKEVVVQDEEVVLESKEHREAMTALAGTAEEAAPAAGASTEAGGDLGGGEESVREVGDDEEAGAVAQEHAAEEEEEDAEVAAANERAADDEDDENDEDDERQQDSPISRRLAAERVVEQAAAAAAAAEAAAEEAAAEAAAAEIMVAEAAVAEAAAEEAAAADAAAARRAVLEAELEEVHQEADSLLIASDSF